MIAEALDGKRVLITGTTGFLGTAILERLLRAVPGCEVVLLVRPGRRTTAAQRVAREVLRNDAFDRLRADLGTEVYKAMTDRRVSVVGGDVGTDGLGLDDAGRDALASCDVVIHSAATVAAEWMTTSHEARAARPSSSRPSPSLPTSPATTPTRRSVMAR